MAHQHRERWLFVGLALPVFTYIICRAATVPLVHDEATSFIAYAQSGRFLPFASMWDANNHFLSSFFGWLGYKLFGLQLLSLRWVSVLSFPVYAWALWRIGAFVRSVELRWMVWAGLLSCPFLLDFFGLFRGYAPGIACMMVVLQAMIRSMSDRTRGGLLTVFIALGLMNAFILAWLPLSWVFLLIILPLCLPDRRTLFLWIGAGLLPTLLATVLAVHMAKLGLLYHGSTDGFMHVTVQGLLQLVLGATHPVLGWSVIVIAAVSLGVALKSALLDHRYRAPLVAIAGAFALELILRLSAAGLFGINYAEDRTALHMLVLFILLFVFALDEMALRAKRTKWFAALLLVLPFRTLSDLNLARTMLWPEQSIDAFHVAWARGYAQALGRPLVVGGHRLIGLPWSLQQRMFHGECDLNAVAWPSGVHDLRLVDDRYDLRSDSDHVEVPGQGSAGLRLLVRREPLQTHVIKDTTLVLYATGGDIPFHDGSAALFVEISGTLSSEGKVCFPRLLTEVLDDSGQLLHSDLVLLETRRERWSGERWNAMRNIPPTNGAYRLRIRLYTDPSGASASARASVRLHRVED